MPQNCKISVMLNYKTSIWDYSCWAVSRPNKPGVNKQNKEVIRWRLISQALAIQEKQDLNTLTHQKGHSPLISSPLKKIPNITNKHHLLTPKIGVNGVISKFTYNFTQNDVTFRRVVAAKTNPTSSHFTPTRLRSPFSSHPGIPSQSRFGTLKGCCAPCRTLES